MERHAAGEAGDPVGIFCEDHKKSLPEPEILADTRTSSPEGEAEMRELTEILNRFLAELPKEKRQIFLKRYWYLCSVREIAAELQLTESKVKMTLLRTREKLAEQLKKEGYLV